AYAISSSIHTQEALRGIWRAHVSYVKERLKADSDPPTPQLVIDRTLDFMDHEAVFPVLRLPLPEVKKRRRRRDEDDDSGYQYDINPYGGSSEMGSWKDIEDLAAIWQTFYADVEDEIRGITVDKKSRESSEGNDSEKESTTSASVSASASVSEDGMDKDMEEGLDVEEKQDREDARVREILERVEK
ncbi:hypothetical protein MPER_15506, partial [Moniliophthora perniciosa FA553]